MGQSSLGWVCDADDLEVVMQSPRYELRLQAFHTRFDNDKSLFFTMETTREAKNNEEALRVEVPKQ